MIKRVQKIKSNQHPEMKSVLRMYLNLFRFHFCVCEELLDDDNNDYILDTRPRNVQQQQRINDTEMF